VDRYQVKNIEFSTRCLTILDEIGVTDIRSLSVFDKETFFRVKGVGVKILHEVEEVMEDLGVK
jgi:DNA-directed RNA polymerase alpha subunit